MADHIHLKKIARQLGVETHDNEVGGNGASSDGLPFAFSCPDVLDVVLCRRTISCSPM